MRVPDIAGDPTINTADLTCPVQAPPPPAPNPALFLDLDGVLAPIMERPEDVAPQPWRTRMLRALGQRLDGRLAVLSGRTLDEIDRILEGSVGVAAGTHGLELRLPSGRTERVPPAEGLAEARKAAGILLAGLPGTFIEDKPAGMALHYRQSPSSQRVLSTGAREIAARHGLELQPGKAVIEIKTPGASKGQALMRLMELEPFAGHLPVMLGDDLTDESAFAACEALGGYGILVGEPRASRARYLLDGPDHVRAWLEAMTGARL